MSPTRVPIPVETAAPGGETNGYLVGNERALLVDPAAATPQLDDAIDGVANLLVTHTHPDHVGGVEAYADRATVWAHAGYADRFEHATGVSPDHVFGPGTRIDTDAGTVELLATPGHAPDHVTLTIDDELLVGDLAVASGSVVVGNEDGDMRGYLTALRRLHARNPTRLYPGHGPIIEESRAVIERLISHRLRREQSVLRAVRDGARTVATVTDGAYEKELSGVRGLAERTVAAHLDKLAVEGRIEWEGEQVHP